MLVGNLDRRVLFQRRQVTRSADGGEQVVWVDMFTLWCQITPLKYKSLEHQEYRADRDIAEKLGEFIIRFRTDIDFQDRIFYNNLYYNIRAIEEVSRRRYLRITANWLDTFQATQS
ncbi:MAG: hypothetical protein DRN81_04990 [Thermoproteota archaeon]|nr:MAG: hypothetical protein DRN81_04990 [Candidatus Korarchaeota archaeon]